MHIWHPGHISAKELVALNYGQSPFHRLRLTSCAIADIIRSFHSVKRAMHPLRTSAGTFVPSRREGWNVLFGVYISFVPAIYAKMDQTSQKTLLKQNAARHKATCREKSKKGKCGFRNFASVLKEMHHFHISPKLDGISPQIDHVHLT